MSTQTITSAITPDDHIEVRPLFDGATACDVLLNGVKVGGVSGDRMYTGRGCYRFADQAAAVEAVISRHRRGWWTGEL